MDTIRSYVSSGRSLLVFNLVACAVFLPRLTLAQTVENGAVLTIDASTAPTFYLVTGQSTLNTQAGTVTDDITLTAGSTLNMQGTTAIGTGTYAVAITDSTATIADSSITSDFIGLNASRAADGSGVGSQVRVRNSSVTGAVSGAEVTGLSTLFLDNVLVNGSGSTANGIDVRGGEVIATGGTQISGGNSGVSISRGAGGIGDFHLALDGASVTGRNGAAIEVIGGVSATVDVANGSSLSGANGVLLDVSQASSVAMNVTSNSLTGTIRVQGASTANLVFDRARLTGEVSADTTSNGALTLNNSSVLTGNVIGIDNVSLSASSMTGNITSDGTGVVSLQNDSVLTGNVIGIDNVSLSASSMKGDITSDGTGVVSLQNNSVFTGNLVGVDRLTVGDPSVWNMTASNTVNNLVMDTGVVKFGAASEFFQLDVGNLSGSGTFVMDADYATNQHDTLNVTGSATGSHTLSIAGSGVDPVSPEPLTIVHTAGGDATFALANGRPVDVGTFSYALGSVGNASGGTDWFLDPSTATISPGTASVLALFNTAPTVWYGELTSLRSRMGELRFNGGKAGGWMRAYGNKYNVDEASGLGYQQTQRGFSLGADAPLPVGDGQWLVGVLAGHSTSDLDLSRGTSGTVKSYYVGGYTTWLDQGTGYYFDGVLKLNRFRNDAKVSMSDGTRAKGDYDNVGMGGSVEFGRHIKLDDGYFVEPFTQWSAVVIQGRDYGLDNGMRAEGDRTRSMLGKVGVTAGRNVVMSNGSVVQPYLKVAGVHEFAKNNEVQVNNNVFNNDLSGSRGELGAGVAVAFSDRLQLHADFDYANGEHIEQPFGANVGVRYSW